MFYTEQTIVNWMELLIVEVDLPMRMKSQREDEKFFHDSVCACLMWSEFVLSLDVNLLDGLHRVSFIYRTKKTTFYFKSNFN